MGWFPLYVVIMVCQYRAEMRMRMKYGTKKSFLDPFHPLRAGTRAVSPASYTVVRQSTSWT